MIEVFYYSIAGKKSNQTIDELLLRLLECPFLSASDKKIVKHTQKVAENGNYPSVEYYSTFYSAPEFKYKSLAEIITYHQKVIDFYKKQHIQKQVITAINDSNSSVELINSLSQIISDDTTDDSDDLEQYAPTLYHHDESKLELGLKVGIPEVDQLTSGFQCGNIASICAFTGHGKSSLCNSITFKNVKEGKKGLIVSIELAPSLVWNMLQARYLYEVKGLSVTTTDLIQKKLTSEMATKVEAFNDDFMQDISSNLMIVDESFLSNQVVSNFKLLNRKLRKVEQKLGGLDFVVWDHVGQLDLLFPDKGNEIIKQIQSSTKTYINGSGNALVTIFAVQCNRDGMKRATRRDGQYDLSAIADLNECERSSSYVLFMYTNDDMKVVQETKVQLLKHRLGGVMPEPIVTTFNPAVITVGSAVEKLTISEEDFASFGDMDFGDDEF